MCVYTCVYAPVHVRLCACLSVWPGAQNAGAGASPQGLNPSSAPSPAG